MSGSPEELRAAITVAKIMRPVLYLGVGPAGYLFADCSPRATHCFQDIEEAKTYFEGRTIRNLPQKDSI